MATSSHPFLRFVPAVAVTVFNLGWDMIGYQNPALGYALWVIAVLLLLVATWPWIKRWRPFTLAPADSETRTDSGFPHSSPGASIKRLSTSEVIEELDAENERVKKRLREVEQEREELRAENEELIAQTEELEKQSADRPDYSGSYFKDQTIYLPDLARKRVIVKDRTFEDCEIRGPAVAAVMQGSDFIDCTFAEAGDRDAMIWPPGSGRKSYLGVIGLENCIFRRCDFITVGLLANVEWPDEQNQATTEA